MFAERKQLLDQKPQDAFLSQTTTKVRIHSVTIKVEWKDVEIASGQTTFFDSDKVTIK